MSDLLSMASDWWSEYAGRVLESESSPLTDAEVKRKRERRMVKRDAQGRAIRSSDDEPDEPLEPINVWML